METLRELVSQWRHNAQGCSRNESHAAATWRSCARELDAAINSHAAVAVVDEEMVERARESFWNDFPKEDREPEWYEWANAQMRAALAAALETKV